MNNNEKCPNLIFALLRFFACRVTHIKSYCQTSQKFHPNYVVDWFWKSYSSVRPFSISFRKISTFFMQMIMNCTTKYSLYSGISQYFEIIACVQRKMKGERILHTALIIFHSFVNVLLLIFVTLFSLYKLFIKLVHLK